MRGSHDVYIVERRNVRSVAALSRGSDSFRKRIKMNVRSGGKKRGAVVREEQKCRAKRAVQMLIDKKPRETPDYLTIGLLRERNGLREN